MIDFKILNDIVGSDHLPLKATIELHNSLPSHSFISWGQQTYSHNIYEALSIDDIYDNIAMLDNKLFDLHSTPVNGCF